MNWLKNIRKKLRSPVCPFCCTRIDNNNLYRCINLPGRCSLEPDKIYAAAWDDTAPRGRVFYKAKTCPTCGQLSSRHICPHCHMDLPSGFGDAEEIMLAIIGAKEAGKSHYLAVLIDRLQNEIATGGARLDATCQFVGETTAARYNKDFREPLFSQRRTLDATRSASANIDARIPMIYRLSINKKKLLGDGTDIGHVVHLVFFDTAGEDLNNQDLMLVLNKYIYNSDGIILLVDPLQLPEVRDRLPTDRSLPNQNSATGDIVTRTTELIRTGKSLRGKHKIDTPIAVTFSKIDAITDLLPVSSQLRGNAKHGKGFDLDDFAAVNGELESWLQSLGERALHSAIRTHFDHYGFFGISALGTAPDQEGKISKPAPHRVEDPFLWLLHEHGLIPGVRRA